MSSRGTYSIPQAVMDIQSIGSHERQSELKCPETRGEDVRASVPAVLLYRSNPPVSHYLPKSQFQCCTLLHWPNCCKAFLGGIYIRSSPLESKDAIAGKSGTA